MLISIIPFKSASMDKGFHPITNSEYNKSLIDRGSLTFWVDAGP